MPGMGDYSAEVAQPVYSIDVNGGLRREVLPRGAEVFHQLARRERRPVAMVDTLELRRRWGNFAPSGGRVGLCDDRPAARVGGRFAAEVPRIEFGDGSIEVVEIEHDPCHDPGVAANLEDGEDIGVESLA